MNNTIVSRQNKIGLRFLFIFLCLMCLSPQISFAQLGEKIDLLQTIEKEHLKVLQSVSYPVNPSKSHDLYLHQEWISGWLSLKDDKVLIPVMARFNILRGAVELMCREQIRVLQTQAVEMVIIGTHLFFPHESSPTNYFEILSDGQLNLLRAYELSYTYESSNTITSAVNGEKKTTSKLAYYYFKEGESAKPLKAKKKKILKLMDNDEQVRKFIETNNLKLSKKEHLVQVFDFFNGM